MSNTIHREIRKARQRKGMSQAQLGRRIGQPQSAVSLIEQDRNVCLSTLMEISKSLDVELRLVPVSLVPAVDEMIEQAAQQEQHNRRTVSFDPEYADYSPPSDF